MTVILALLLLLISEIATLSYKPAGRGFDWLNLSDRTVVPESIQPVTEMSKRLSPGG